MTPPRLLLPLIAAVAQAQDPMLWGELKPGPHAVGFRSSIAMDASRKYDGKARPILLDVWYPAAPASIAPLLYEVYLRVPDAPGHPKFKPRLERFIREAIAGDLFHEKTAALDLLVALRTTAHLNAEPAAGRFPVVIYHPGAGGSFEDNSVLFEYLASNGYTVVSSAYQSPFPDKIGNNIGGIERSGPDLTFIARRYPDAPIAVLGHSAGAQNMMQWIGSPECPARAFVSLDTTLEYTEEKFKGHKSVRDALKRLTPPRIPVLLFAQARLNPRFATFDKYLRNSPHEGIAVPDVEHDDFLMHGYLGRTFTSQPNAAAARRAYEEMCRTILAFLDRSSKVNR